MQYVLYQFILMSDWERSPIKRTRRLISKGTALLTQISPKPGPPNGIGSGGTAFDVRSSVFVPMR